jgi:hypothetical protein
VTKGILVPESSPARNLGAGLDGIAAYSYTCSMNRAQKRRGAPRVRDGGFLYPRGDDLVPIISAWLIDVAEEDAWEVQVRECGGLERLQTVRYDEEEAARAGLADVYGQLSRFGSWKILRHDPM